MCACAEDSSGRDGVRGKRKRASCGPAAACRARNLSEWVSPLAVLLARPACLPLASDGHCGAGRRFGGKGTWTGLRASAGRRRYRLSSDLPKHPPPDRRRPSPPHLASSSYLLPSPPLQPLLASPSPPSPVRPPMENGSRPPKHGGAGKLTSNTKGRKAPLPKEPDADDVVSRLPPLLFWVAGPSIWVAAGPEIRPGVSPVLAVAGGRKGRSKGAIRRRDGPPSWPAPLGPCLPRPRPFAAPRAPASPGADWSWYSAPSYPCAEAARARLPEPQLLPVDGPRAV